MKHTESIVPLNVFKLYSLILKVQHNDKKAACVVSQFLRLQVEHQRGVLQAYWVAAHGVVDGLAGGEGWSTPAQKHRAGAVALDVDVVWRRWRRHQAISDSYEIH